MLLSGISPMGFGRSLCPPPTPEAPDEVEELGGDEGRWCGAGTIWKPSLCHQASGRRAFNLPARHGRGTSDRAR